MKHSALYKCHISNILSMLNQTLDSTDQKFMSSIKVLEQTKTEAMTHLSPENLRKPLLSEFVDFHKPLWSTMRAVLKTIWDTPKLSLLFNGQTDTFNRADMIKWTKSLEAHGAHTVNHLSKCSWHFNNVNPCFSLWPSESAEKLQLKINTRIDAKSLLLQYSSGKYYMGFTILFVIFTRCEPLLLLQCL